MTRLFLWAGVTCVLSISAFGEVVEGGLDLRPSYVASQGLFRTENELAARYLVTPTIALGYVQELQTQGNEFFLFDGYAKATINDGEPGFGYEARLHAPTNQEERDAGFVTAMRNTLKYTLPLTDSQNLVFAESPIVYWYRDPNKTFENRFQIEWEWRIAEPLAFKLPFIVQNIREPEEWTETFWINPELIYAVGPKTGLGVAYYTENLLEADGFKNGVGQLVLQQAL